MRRHRHERQRRNELHNITIMGDLNELTISCHVEHQPELREDHTGERVCEFVLTHHAVSCGVWMLERYTVEATGQLGQNHATNWQPGQAIIVDGRLEYRDCDTLAGPLASITIIAHHIATLGEHPHTGPPPAEHRVTTCFTSSRGARDDDRR